VISSHFTHEANSLPPPPSPPLLFLLHLVLRLILVAGFRTLVSFPIVLDDIAAPFTIVGPSSVSLRLVEIFFFSTSTSSLVFVRSPKPLPSQQVAPNARPCSISSLRLGLVLYLLSDACLFKYPTIVSPTRLRVAILPGFFGDRCFLPLRVLVMLLFPWKHKRGVCPLLASLLQLRFCPFPTISFKAS